MGALTSIPRDVSSADATRLFLSARDLLEADTVQTAARRVCAAVREAVGADGATFVLREQDQVYYAEEDAVDSLWKGRRFPADACISGWAAIHGETAVIERIYDDIRIPAAAYQPTFVQSLCMTPMGRNPALGAVGAYWGHHHRATEREVWLLEQLAEAAHAALLRAAQLARESTAAPEDRAARLLAVMAHDLRQPLSTLSYGLELLQADERFPHHELIDRLRRSAAQATDLVRSAADLTDLARGALSLRLADARVDELCREVASEFDPACSRIRVEAKPTTGMLDGERIREAVANLVGNALQHGAADRPVTLRLTADGPRARIEVHNHGTPIAAGQREAIFRPFQRFGQNGSGSVGLGLYIADQITRAHGGTLEVQSDAQAGTTFTLSLPLAPTTLAAG